MCAHHACRQATPHAATESVADLTVVLMLALVRDLVECDRGVRDGRFDELRGALERQVELTSAHARFVPHAFLEMLNRPSIADVRLGDHVQAEAQRPARA